MKEALFATIPVTQRATWDMRSRVAFARADPLIEFYGLNRTNIQKIKMKWIEWIKLQSADLSDETARYVVSLSRKIHDSPGLTNLGIYTHAVFQNEIALLFFWDADLPRFNGSQVGLQIVEELKHFGMVSHAVWIGL